MKTKGQNNTPSPWQGLESFFGNKLPALPSSEQLDLLKDTSWVEDYVQQMLEKSLPKTAKLHGLRSKAEVFETHYHVIAKTPVAYESNPVVKVRTDLIKIENMSNSNKQIIRLPCLVVPGTARATYKDGILQIKARKKKLNKTYREVSIRYI